MLKFKKVDFAPKDVLHILRWPDACVSCGSNSIADVTPEYIPKVITVKKDVSGTETRFWYKVKAKLYLCMECRQEILTAKEIPSKGFRGHGDLIEKLLNDPYGSFLGMHHEGGVAIAEGPFLDELISLNPENTLYKMKNPLVELRKKLPKDAEIAPVSMEVVSAWNLPKEPRKDALLPQAEDPENIQELKKRLNDEPEIGDNWIQLVQGLISSGDCKGAAITVMLSEQAFNHFTLNLQTVEKLRQIAEENCGDLMKAFMGK